MASNMPAKLVLKGTSNMSLNERFSKLPSKAAPPATPARQNAAQQQQASARNRRLAQQMANRPSVLTALSGNQSGRGRTPRRGRGRGRGSPAAAQVQQNRGPVQSRLNLRGRGNVRGAVTRGRGANRGAPSPARGRGAAHGRGRRRRGFDTLGGGDGTYNNTTNRKSFGGNPQGSPRGRSLAIRGTTRGDLRARGGRGGVWRGGERQVAVNKRGRGARGAGRGAGRGGRGAARGRGADRGGRKVSVNQSDLDKELDAYMAQTKSMDDSLLL